MQVGDNVFERDNFLKSCDKWIKEKIIDKETAILSWNKLCEELRLPYRIVVESGTHKLPPTRKLKPNELQLLYLYNPETGLHHFVIGNEADSVVYDSYGESKTVRAYNIGVGYIESKRVFKKV